jgi:hypothetical protein
MTNHSVTKLTNENDESSNEQGRRRQRRRIHLNQDQDQSGQVVPTIVDIILRNNIGGSNIDLNSTHVAPSQSLPPGTEIPYQPLDISSVLRLSSTMRNDSSTSGSINRIPTTTGFATPIASHPQPPFNREGLIHILDCALAICDECLEDVDIEDEESDQP